MFVLASVYNVVLSYHSIVDTRALLVDVLDWRLSESWNVNDF